MCLMLSTDWFNTVLTPFVGNWTAFLLGHRTSLPDSFSNNGPMFMYRVLIELTSMCLDNISFYEVSLETKFSRTICTGIFFFCIYRMCGLFKIHFKFDSLST